MRILRIDSWDGAPGGAQDYIREVTSELAGRGHHSRVIQLTGGAPTLPPPVGVPEPIPTGVRRWGGDLTVDVGLVDRIRGQIREFDPDLISLHHFDARFTTIADVLADCQRPVVFAAHDAELVCPISTLVRPGGILCDGGVRFRCLFTGCKVGFGGPYNLWQTRVFDSRVRDHVRVFLCPSRSLTSYLSSNGYEPALHLPSFARIPESVRRAKVADPSAGSPPTIGYIGRLEWYKGVHDLIRGLPDVVRAVPSVRLDIAGDGPYRPTLERLASAVGVRERVVFRGPVRGEEKEAWFAGVHVVAVPSNMWENFPLVALEAFARGRPVVATEIGGIPDIVDEGESGYLVPIDRPELLAERLVRLLSDPSRARSMGETGRTRVLERFTPELHVERLLAVYDAVLKGSPLATGEAADLVTTRRSGG
ncbi:MAG TPA: glycosyltransferase family 4 protein [Thermoplasmata archaeon]|nr:glycosyltransferase family 4 protein [Thermoplasmata archaeon]